MNLTTTKLVLLSLFGTSISQADLVIDFYENTTNGKTVMELNGTLIADTDDGTENVPAFDDANIAPGFFGGNQLSITNYPELIDAAIALAALPRTSGNFDGFSQSPSGFTDTTATPTGISATFSSGVVGFSIFFTGSADDEGFNFVLAGAPAPASATFSDQKTYFDLNWSEFVPGQTAEYGTFGGIVGDGVQVNTLVEPPVESGPTILAAMATGPASQPDLTIGTKKKKQKGNGRYDRRKASNKQTIHKPGRIFVNNTSTAFLTIQNDGTAGDTVSFDATVKRKSRVDVKAYATKNGKRNTITAQIRSGNYRTTLAPGESEEIKYEMKTDRFYAGLAPGRDNWVDFILRSGSLSDRGRMVIQYK